MSADKHSDLIGEAPVNPSPVVPAAARLEAAVAPAKVEVMPADQKAEVVAAAVEGEQKHDRRDRSDPYRYQWQRNRAAGQPF